MFKSIAAVPKYDRNKSFTFSSIEINMIKFITNKIYTWNAYFITRKCDISKIIMKNRTLPSVYKALWRILITFNREQILMLVEKYQRLHHTFFLSCIYQGNIFGSFKTNWSHNYWQLHRSGTELNTKRQVSKFSTHIYWAL